MTSYATADASAHNGSPFSLFKFESEGDNYYYTDKSTFVVFDGNRYEPAQIARGLIDVGNISDSPSTVDITLSINTQLFLDYGLDFTPPSLLVTVYRKHRTSDGYARQVVGTVTGHKVDDDKYVLSIQNKLQTDFNNALAAVIFDNRCNNLFGDKRCRFDVASKSVYGNVVPADSTALVIKIDKPLTPDFFANGILQIAGQARAIMSNTADTVTIAYPFGHVKTNICVVKPGCDKSRTQCLAYNNIDQFSGFQAIPTENPIATDLAAVNAKFLASKDTTESSRWTANYGGRPFG